MAHLHTKLIILSYCYSIIILQLFSVEFSQNTVVCFIIISQFYIFLQIVLAIYKHGVIINLSNERQIVKVQKIKLKKEVRSTKTLSAFVSEY